MPVRYSPLLAVACVAASLCAQTKPPVNAHAAAPSTRVIDHDLYEVTIPELEEFYAKRKYTALQVVHWYADRIQKYNGIYKDIQTLDLANALQAAADEDNAAATGGSAYQRGPLWGVPVVIKANTCVKGLITTDGWQGYKIPGHEFIAPKDATVVAKLRAAGAIILGQTNMPDFAASDTNRSTAFGRTGNAYDVRFSPGGSSGGTVTAVTSNEAMFGTGTDTGNSIRMPSSTSAVVGVFPTRGLVSIAGIAPLDWLLDNTGPIARDVTDAAIALGVMAGEDPLDPRTLGSAAKAQAGPYTRYLDKDALKGKRFGVPAFILHGTGTPFQGVDASVPGDVASAEEDGARGVYESARRAACSGRDGRVRRYDFAGWLCARGEPYRHAAVYSRGHGELSARVWSGAISLGGRVRESGRLAVACNDYGRPAQRQGCGRADES
jgi:Asp-tRNA(Asn)/Glu-tRNA(Gln) amidotransferase A subunit family amidase